MDPLAPLARARLGGCPSDLRLSQHGAGVITDAELAAHVATCVRCAAFLEDERAGFLSITSKDRARITLAMMNAQPKRRAHLYAPFIAAFAAAAAIVLAQRPPPEDDGLRAKGASDVLRVYVERGGEVIEAQPDERLRPRDRLRFEVELPSGGHAMIVGAESDGSLYAAYPATASTSTTFAPGHAQLLEGAIALDGSLGQETLNLVVCPSRFGLSELRAEGPKLAAPTACRVSALRIEKVAP